MMLNQAGGFGDRIMSFLISGKVTGSQTISGRKEEKVMSQEHAVAIASSESAPSR